jgi:hypothetical protein
MAESEFQAQVISMLTGLKADVAQANERIGNVSERVARVEVVHVERCSANGRRLEDLERGQEEQGREIQGLKEHRSFSRGQQAALTAVGTMAGAAVGVLAEHVLFGGK